MKTKIASKNFYNKPVLRPKKDELSEVELKKLTEQFIDKASLTNNEKIITEIPSLPPLPKKKKQIINIHLPEDYYNILKEISKHTGHTKHSILLEIIMPVLLKKHDKMLKLLKKKIARKY